MLRVLAPISGGTLAVDDIPDPVFARGLVGAGVAIRPRAGRQHAVAPISGRLVKLHPHAYLVVSDQGPGVLVHLGIDTVRMQGDGFELLTEEHCHVEAGDAMVSWDPDAVESSGRSPVCAVVAVDCDPGTVLKQAVHVPVEAGDLLFLVEC